MNNKYLKKYNHELVKIALIGCKELSSREVGILRGTLHTCPEDNYNIELEFENGSRMLIPKHSILYIKSCLKKKRRLRNDSSRKIE